MNETVLQHWGIKGMKWGIRRYQNKDGTLTALGRKREREMNDKLKSANKELKALRAENEKLKKHTSANSKNLYGLSNEEVQARIDRLNLEKKYAEVYSQVHPSSNKPSKGKEFVDKFLNEAVIPSVTNVGKSLIEKTLKKAFGIEDKPDQSKAIEIATKKAELAIKQIDYETKKYDLDSKKNPKSNNDKKSDKKADKKADNTKSDNKKTDDKKSDDKKAKDKKANDKTNANKTVYEDPEVIFNPNAKKKGGGYRGEKWKKRPKSDIIIDADWVDLGTSTSDLKGTEIVLSGRSFISGLLEEPR